MNTSPLFWEQPLREIWPDLQQLDPHIQILGGYGLYLKQRWLADNPGGTTSLVPLVSWTNAERLPRTTKDIDVGIQSRPHYLLRLPAETGSTIEGKRIRSS